MTKKLLISLLFFSFSFAKAATIKTDVLVIGGGSAGVAAAIQSSRSKLKTILVEQGHGLGGYMPVTGSGMCILTANRYLPSGIWGEFRQKVIDHYRSKQGYDTTYNSILKFEPSIGAEILKKITDTVKNLTVKLNTAWTSIKKDGTGWEVSITENGKTVIIKAKVVVDGTEKGEVAAKAGAQFLSGLEKRSVKGMVFMVWDDIINPYERELKLYRTSITVVDAMLPYSHHGEDIRTAIPSYSIPLGVIVVNGQDNLLVTENAISVSAQVSASTMDPAIQMTLGQGIGATAAYCAFFKTTTKHLNVRIIQGEILDHKGYLMPFTDIPQKDRNFRAIQQIGATGLLKGIQLINDNALQAHFNPNDTVKTDEIKPVLTEMYARAFLWFNKEKPGDKFTVGNMLSLISDFTLADPATLQIYLKKAWKEQFRLTGTFDLSRPITRLEFAVLVNKYLNPFGKKIDLNGRLVN